MSPNLPRADLFRGLRIEVPDWTAYYHDVYRSCGVRFRLETKAVRVYLSLPLYAQVGVHFFQHSDGRIARSNARTRLTGGSFRFCRADGPYPYDAILRLFVDNRSFWCFLFLLRTNR